MFPQVAEIFDIETPHQNAGLHISLWTLRKAGGAGEITRKNIGRIQINSIATADFRLEAFLYHGYSATSTMAIRRHGPSGVPPYIVPQMCGDG
jgi:hypothetical protein